MILDLAGPGPLGAALRAALDQAAEPYRSHDAPHPDLLGAACGCRGIVYAPSPSLLAGRLAPAPDVDRMRAVLGATNAPGVRALVVVSCAGYEPEEDALRRYGVPYVVLRAAPLLEELASDPSLRGSGAVWLPRGRTTRVARAEALAAEVVRALDEATGATIDAPSESMDAAEALQRAAKLAGRDGVRTIAPAIDGALRVVGKAFGIKAPPVVALHASLASAAA
jgi:hypothetical protein